MDKYIIGTIIGSISTIIGLIINNYLLMKKDERSFVYNVQLEAKKFEQQLRDKDRKEVWNACREIHLLLSTINAQEWKPITTKK